MILKILIILSGPLYFRNYLQSEALSAIDDEDCYIAADDSVAAQVKASHAGRLVGSFAYSTRSISLYLQAFNILNRRYAYRSRTFAYRFKRLYGVWSQPVRTPLGWIRRISLNLFYRVGGSSILAPAVLALLKLMLKPNPGLAAVIDSVRPDIVVVPTGLMDHVANDAVRICRARNIKTFLLVDNWDGMVSKTLMWDLPDYVGAWGEQTCRFAESVHGMPYERTFAIGTPRYEIYYQPRQNQERLYDFPYALFCGSAVPFDELSALRRLEEEIDSNPETYRGLRIVYRPHPWRHKRSCKDQFLESHFRHVVMDRQVRENYHDPQGRRFQPDLGYYRSLLDDAELVVGPPTSMTVEGLICGKSVLTLAYDDGVHIESPHNTYRNYMNLEGIERIVGNTMVTDRDVLGERFRSVYASAEKPTLEQIRESLDFILAQGSEGYPSRLQRALDEIAQQSSIPR